MDAAKLIRRTRKGAITRHLGTLARCVADEDTEAVNDRLTQLKISFNEFETAHEAYHSLLDKEDDKDQSYQWFDEVQQNYVTGVKDARTWLRAVNNPPASHTLSDKLENFFSLPRVEIERFAGDPLEYQSFITVFDELVDSKVDDANVKLTRLLQYTTSEAKDAIKSCALIGGVIGYKQARDTLKCRFGDPYQVAQRIVSSLKKGAPVKSPRDLQHLSDELITATTALEQLKMLCELDTQNCIIDITSRCQPYVRNAWRRNALSIKHDQGSYPSFKAFVDFMKMLSLDACDPVYGTEACSIQNSKPSKSVTSHSVETCPSTHFESGSAVKHTQQCFVCNDNHRLFYCQAFKSLRPQARLDVVVKNKLCFNCLLPGHFSKECHKNTVCSVPGCGRKHTKFIHIDNVNTNVARNYSPPPTQPILNHMNVEACSNVYLPIVPVVINNMYHTQALLDTGSTNTFVTENLVSNMKLVGNSLNFRMSTLNKVASNVESKVVNIDVVSVDGKTILNADAIVVPSIPARYPPKSVNLNMFPHLANLPINTRNGNVKVEVLIGMDNAWALAPLEIKQNHANKRDPYATRTVFGWTLNGPVGGRTSHIFSNFVDVMPKSYDTGSTLFEVESDDTLSMSVEDQRVLELWENEIKFEDGHYTLPIPWKAGKPNFPDNKPVAMNRLKGLISKLKKKDMLSSYDDVVKAMLKDNYAEKVPPKSGPDVWYLPHHAVISASKPGKIRVVFDCAAKLADVSLNNQCFQGPDLNNKLVDVLLLFRQYKYAIMADVTAMYHQVKIPQKNRDSLRFLWLDELNENSLSEYRMTSHLFGGVWCASSSTFALRKTVVHFPVNELVTETVNKSFYVDDMLVSTKSEENALNIVQGVKHTLKQGGFKLTKFVVNSDYVLSKIDKDDHAKEVKVTSDINAKALGVMWNVTEDNLYYVVKLEYVSTQITKRIILSQLSSIYDPLGLIAPVIVQGKMLFQDASRLQLNWDCEVPNDLAKRWRQWLSTLVSVQNLKFPRCLLPEKFADGLIELHHFCDASEAGYGACTYLRVINCYGEINVTLVTSKSRLSPLKQITIPRLELSAAVLAVGLDHVVRRMLHVSVGSTFWSDSKIVLAYIMNESRRFKVFVANRVSKIRSFTTPEQWRHISGSLNPADVLSRGCQADRLPDTWSTGPAFLHHPKSTWPLPSLFPSVLLADNSDVKVSHAVVRNEPDDTHPLELMMNYYSSHYRLTKGVSWLLRFLQLIRKQDVSPFDYITVGERKSAEKLLLTHVQGSSYKNEITALKQENPISKSSSLLALNPVLDNDLIVVGGRMPFAQNSRPIILPRGHRLSYLIAQEYHSRAHLGTEWTLSLLRQKFWITCARSLIKKIKASCITCKKLYGAPMLQKMANLPIERCEPGNPPFSYVGVDLFGPFYVKVGRAQVKRYGCLFTCFSTRAIHLEVLHSLETDTFINGFIRFCSRRGYPIKVWSDNGTNLVGAKSELAKSLRQLNRHSVIEAACRHEVTWIFNPPLASHHGGVWERMIRTVRRVLVSLINVSSAVSDDVLLTVFCEVENIVNSRPLTKSSDDVSDATPLTPNHLLMLRSNSPWPWGVISLGDTYRRKWRHVQQIVDTFWKRWLKEYLPELQRRQKWHNVVPNIKVGDIVLLIDESSPRGLWPIGKIISVTDGRDGLVRSVRVKTMTSEYVRPITKIVLLEGVDYV